MGVCVYVCTLTPRWLPITRITRLLTRWPVVITNRQLVYICVCIYGCLCVCVHFDPAVITNYQNYQTSDQVLTAFSRFCFSLQRQLLYLKIFGKVRFFTSHDTNSDHCIVIRLGKKYTFQVCKLNVCLWGCFSPCLLFYTFPNPTLCSLSLPFLLLCNSLLS